MFSYEIDLLKHSCSAVGSDLDSGEFLECLADAMPFEARRRAAGMQLLMLKKSPDIDKQVMNIWEWRLPEELRVAVPARKYEFIAGRLAVASLLGRLGRKPEWLGISGRRPVWPQDITGSISHTTALIAVVVALPCTGIRSIGIDIERLDCDAATMRALRICFSDAEWGRLVAVPYGPLIGFAAKESLFKCVNPITDLFLDFADAEVTEIDATNCRLHLSVRTDLSLPLAMRHEVSATYRISQGHVVVSVIHMC